MLLIHTKRRRWITKKTPNWRKRRLIIQFNEDWNPCGGDQKQLATQLGVFVKNWKLFPLTKESWNDIDEAVKERMWTEIQQNTNVPPEYKRNCLLSMSHQWRIWKCRVKEIGYDAFDNDDDRKANYLEGVYKPDWPDIVTLWGLEKSQKIAKVNKINRLKLSQLHITGKMPISALKKQRHDKEEPVDRIKYKRNCLLSMSYQWRIWKCRVKEIGYDAFDNDDDRKTNYLEGVYKPDWPDIVTLWGSEKSQKIAKVNNINRLNLSQLHTTGKMLISALKKQQNTNVPPEYKRNCLLSMSHQWRIWKYRVKEIGYDAFDNDDDRKANYLEGVHKPDWPDIVTLWGSEKSQKIAKVNKINRLKLSQLHTTGKMSISALKKQRHDKGGPVDRISMYFAICANSKDRAVNDIIDNFKEVIEQLPEEDRNCLEKREEIFLDTFGKDGHMVRCVACHVVSHLRSCMVKRSGSLGQRVLQTFIQILRRKWILIDEKWRLNLIGTSSPKRGR